MDVVRPTLNNWHEFPHLSVMTGITSVMLPGIIEVEFTTGL